MILESPRIFPIKGGGGGGPGGGLQHYPLSVPYTPGPSFLLVPGCRNLGNPLSPIPPPVDFSPPLLSDSHPLSNYKADNLQ